VKLEAYSFPSAGDCWIALCWSTIFAVMNMSRKPPFSLWVENVEPERIDAKDLWEAFARFGDMCKPRDHGARAVEILPDSKAAIVNFASYEHACAALKGLQGALIGKITRPGLIISWHKRHEELPQKQTVTSNDKNSKDRPPFFGLWVGNVHASLVDEDEFRSAFEKFGELCQPQVHGVPSINILPESSSAFVNFSRYEDANAARKCLQGKLIGGAGPLRINASDLMQEYEQQQQLQLQKQAVERKYLDGGLESDTQFPPVRNNPTSSYEICGSPPSAVAPTPERGTVLITDDGPWFELLGGELYVYEAGDVIRCFDVRPGPAAVPIC
jgi:hypothetical protein